MARAYGATTFDEEKRAFLEKAGSLPARVDWRPLVQKSSDTWQRAMDFRNQFRYASAEIHHDRDVALAAVAVYGCLLAYCSDPLRNDLEVARKAVANCASAIWLASKALHSNRELVLEAVGREGGLLVSAIKEFRNDPEVVLAAVKNDGAALEYASKELRNEKDIVLAAVECDPRALDFASEGLRADREVVITALVRQSEQPAWKEDTVWEATSRSLKQDKDFVLLAARAVAQKRSARGCYEEADSSLKRAIPWKEFLATAQSAIACPGEEFPVLNLTLLQQPPCFSEDASGLRSSFACLVTLLSGNSFTCRLPASTFTNSPSPSEEPSPSPKRQKTLQTGIESNDVATPPAATVNDLALTVLAELPNHTEAGVEPMRAFFFISKSPDGESEQLTPWEWKRPLADFFCPA